MWIIVSKEMWESHICGEPNCGCGDILSVDVRCFVDVRIQPVDVGSLSRIIDAIHGALAPALHGKHLSACSN